MYTSPMVFAHQQAYYEAINKSLAVANSGFL